MARSSSKHHRNLRAPKFSVRYMDSSVDPRKDIYRYAVGRWIESHPLPPDKSRYGVFDELEEWNLMILRKIATKCASDRSAPQMSVVRIVGDFYRSAMNTKRIETAKFQPIEDLWGLAEDVGSAREAAELVPRLHEEGVDVLFRTYSDVDDKDSRIYAFFMRQGGLSLPDREYYLASSFAGVRKQFRDHIVRMLSLKELPKEQAGKWADAVLKIETALAKISRTRTDLRDREKNYNRTEVSELEKKYPLLAPLEYLRGARVPSPSYVVVGQPEFFTRLGDLLAERSVDEWRAYFCWHVLNSAAPFLCSAVEEEHFDFFRRKLTGQKEPEPRWKLSLRVIDDMVGEALGKLYAEENFPEEARRRAMVLVDDLRQVFRKRLETLPWMTETTRKQALAKFDNFKAKIGHPEKFRDYSSIRIDPGDYMGNVRRAGSFEFHRQTGRVGGLVDRGEWGMTPPTVNAYFDESRNEIVFPAGILQPPFFDHQADDAVNYGGIGAVIGHEITHGYDDQGRKYDAKGNLRDWWTDSDAKEFNRRARSVVEVYSAQVVLPGLHVNGRLTLGENIADLGGVSLAYEALQRRLGKVPAARKKRDGFTPEQRFFLSFAQIWGQRITEQETRRRVTIDPHSPGKFRGSLPLVNHPAFDQAFPPKNEGAGKEATEKRIGVW